MEVALIFNGANEGRDVMESNHGNQWGTHSTNMKQVNYFQHALVPHSQSRHTILDLGRKDQIRVRFDIKKIAYSTMQQICRHFHRTKEITMIFGKELVSFWCLFFFLCCCYKGFFRSCRFMLTEWSKQPNQKYKHRLQLHAE